MNKYCIKISRSELAMNNVQTYVKWANDHKQALSYIFKTRNKDGFGVLKRGGSAKILSVKRIG